MKNIVHYLEKYIHLNYIFINLKYCYPNEMCVPLEYCPSLYHHFQFVPPFEIFNEICDHDKFGTKVCCLHQPPFPMPPMLIFEENRNKRPNFEMIKPKYPKLPKICGKQKTAVSDRFTSQIIGGEKTSLYEFPWMALLRYKNNQFGCGGTLINERYIVSAAHCVKGESVKRLGGLFQVRLGEYDLFKEIDCENKVCSPKVQDINVEISIAHPYWQENNRNQYHDISLIRLEKNAKFSDFVSPICLPNKNLLSYGHYLLASGWGQTANDYSSNVKLKLEVPLFDKKKCDDIYNQYFSPKINLSDYQICAGGEKGKDTCKGDSGGGLFYNYKETWFLVGIVSFGPKPCGLENKPVVYTNVESYVDWIVFNLK